MPDNCREKLSEAIDAMNRNEQTKTNDPELRGLLAVAETVKKYGQLDADSAIIRRLGDVISADLVNRRRRKRLISAFGGIAAAVWLVTFASYQVLLPANEQNPLANSTNSSQFAKTEIVKPEEKTVMPNHSLPSAQEGVSSSAQRTAKTNTAKRKESASAAPDWQGAKSGQTAAGATKSTEDQKSLIVASAPNQEASVSAPSLGTAEPSSRQSKGNTALLILPGRQADSVSVETAGTVRQVYGRNTDKEVVVTQKSGGSAGSTAVGAGGRTAAVNRITKNINGFEVTIEGKQPQAELERMADSLVPASSLEHKDEPKQ